MNKTLILLEPIVKTIIPAMIRRYRMVPLRGFMQRGASGYEGGIVRRSPAVSSIAAAAGECT